MHAFSLVSHPEKRVWQCVGDDLYTTFTASELLKLRRCISTEICIFILFVTLFLFIFFIYFLSWSGNNDVNRNDEYGIVIFVVVVLVVVIEMQIQLDFSMQLKLHRKLRHVGLLVAEKNSSEYSR